MIPLGVFYLHVVFVTWLFTRWWQREGVGDGLLAVFFAGLIFFVGWAVSSFLIRLIVPDGSSSPLDPDSLALLLLTGAESVFYYFYLRSEDEKL
jgi:hypothetical protein